MITYLFLDEKNKQHSIADVDGVQVEFWHSLIDDYSQEEVEAYLQAEVLRLQNDKDGVTTLLQPYMGGENTYKIEHIEDEDGNLVSVESGADTRTWLQTWYEAYYG
jgi:predicted PilT family ATPase